MTGRTNEHDARPVSNNGGIGAFLWRYHAFVLFGMVAGLLIWTHMRARVVAPQPPRQTAQLAEPAAKTNASEDTALNLASKMRDEARQRLAEAQTEFTQLREQIHKLTPLNPSHVRDRISAYQIALTKLRTDRIRLENDNESIKNAMAAGTDKSELLTAVLKANGDPRRELDATSPRSLEETLSLLELQEKDLLLVLGTDHPEVVELHRQIEWTKLRIRIEGKAKVQVVPVKRTHPLDLHLQVLAQEIEANELQTQYVTKEIAKDQTLLGALVDLMDKEKALNDQCERLGKALAGCEDRVLQLQIERAQKH